VIYRGEVAIGTAQLATRHAQAIKRLRAGDFVYKVQVNVNERGLAIGLSHDVPFPNFIKECSWCGHSDIHSILRSIMASVGRNRHTRTQLIVSTT
jgi:hypothetical protein